MSADLLAEFGQAPSAAQSSSGPTQTAQPSSSFLIDNTDQSDDIFFGNSSKAPIQSAIHSQQHGWKASGPGSQPSEALRQAAHRPQSTSFDLPRNRDSDVLFDATEDSPAGSSDEDDWGDFEGPATNATQPPKQANSQIDPRIPATQATRTQIRQAQGSSSVVDLLGELSVSESEVRFQEPVPTPSFSRPGPNDDSFEDWGDFTKAQAVKPPPPEHLPEEQDSFSEWDDFTDGAPTQAVPSAPDQSQSSRTASASSPFSSVKSTPAAMSMGKSSSQMPKKSTSPAQDWDEDSFEDWADFNDDPETQPPQVYSTSTPKPPQPPSLATSASTSTIKTSHPGPTTSTPIVRPTNIPPPSILLEHLLSLMRTVINEAQTAQARPGRQREQLAPRIQNILYTAARIIAGRTYRWKRDTILAQSMRIGPARAGKAGGMKLSAVNKHENVKEEQDAVDLLTIWRERASLLNAVVQSAGLKPVPALPSPAALKVFTARAEQGAIKAGHACALCALKRDERLLKIDDDQVQDSFGEWWTDHWGHTGCRVFWEENRGLLMQR
ncbi:hypothetical protein N7539_001513 [Penicillium diatomitis]|uniref:Serine/threonine-protein kinase ppk6 n=1 Tax=Penicillium diatomitis TaxID=2819901 RepID=A0A9W9XGW7_9EURO|nr:uncharacterized protein N7539_001513 [Penicillium diatomitis]KAJ5492767.1 hypothetical protein N7539_001513 [Penicillium diatomitis]